MTNGEKIQQMFPNAEIGYGLRGVVAVTFIHKTIFDLDWWNAEYKEPITRNCFGCKYSKDNHNAGTEECHLCMWENQYTPTTKNDLGVDCVDRQAAIAFVCKNTEEILKDTMPLEVKLSDDYLYENVAKIMRNPKVLSSVTPIRPKGHWIEYSWNDNGFGRWGLKCDKCLKKYKYGGEMWGHPCFCPNCGADMREVKE